MLPSDQSHSGLPCHRESFAWDVPRRIPGGRGDRAGWRRSGGSSFTT